MIMVSRFRSVDWLAVVLYPLAVILMEAFWVYPWLVWIGVWPSFAESRPSLSLASVIIVLAVSLLVIRVFLRQKWPMRLIQSAVIGCGLVTIFLVVHVEYGAGYAFLSGQWFIHMGHMLGTTFAHPYPIALALPVSLYLWWRGIILGRTISYFSTIYRSFILGMVALIILIILWQLFSSGGTFSGPESGIGFYVMAFFFFGLIAIAICHFYLMRSTMPREEAALTSVWRWLPIMLGVIGGMVAVGFGVASIFSAEFFASIGQGAKVVFGVLGKIFDYILIPFSYLVEGIYFLMRLIASWLRSEQLLEPPTSDNGSPFEEFTDVVPKTLPPEVMLAIKWVVIAAIVAAVIFILAKAISRYRAEHAKSEIEEIHESLLSWRGLKDDLRLLFSMMGQKFRRKPAASSGHYIDENALGRLNIREIYRHLLWEGARSGVARRSYETTCEYAKRLEQTAPDGEEQLTQITDLYGGVRYGDIPAQEGQIDSANNLWGTLRGLLRRLRGA